jgi:hypothetical protein
MESHLSTYQSAAERALDHGSGVLRLAPTWVPRAFCVPGRRIKLHPDDYYALGGERGGIDERWFSSAIRADNGPLTGPDEGLSLIVGPGDERIPLDEAVAALGGSLIGERLWQSYGKWPIYSKFFDNQAALPFHIHQRNEHAALVGQAGKPEAYYFPVQLNNHDGNFPHTFFGLHPDTKPEQLRACLAAFRKGDNHITGLSKAYRLRVGTGWDVPAGILHAPGSLCTYEPQRDSDVFGMFESLTGNQVIAEELLWKDAPRDRKGDLDLAVSWIDWDANVDADFAAHHFMAPIPVMDVQEMEGAGYNEQWIVYRSPALSAKELTVLPGRTAVIRDAAAYGLIAIQGHGTLGQWPLEAPAIIRYGQLTNDEYFVSEAAARNGLTITNQSACDPLVMLKHFGPGNPELKLT